MIITSDPSLITQKESPTSYQGYNFKLSTSQSLHNLKGNKHFSCFRTCYFNGSAPENGYTADVPLAISVSRTMKISEEEMKLFIDCIGAASPRPITLKKNSKGIWKAKNISSLFSGIRPPAGEEVEGDF